MPLPISSPVVLQLKSAAPGQPETRTNIDVWDRYTVATSMLEPGTPFTFSLWRSDVPGAGSAWAEILRVAKLFAEARLFIDGALQVDGIIEAIDIGADRSGARIIVSGRDKSGAAMSFDADPKLRLRGLPLQTALSRIFEPLGLPLVITEAAAARAVTLRDAGIRRPRRRTSRASRGSTVDLAHPRPGDKVWQLADTIVRRQGFMMWVSPGESGLTVVVDVPGYGSERRFAFRRAWEGTGQLRVTGNILAGFDKYQIRDVPTEVHVYTGTARGDSVSARTETINDNGVFNDTPGAERINRGFVSVPARPQPRHIKSQRARTIQAGLQEGSRVLADAMAKFRVYECTVQGHGQPGADGRLTLYAVNTMCRVYDELCAGPTGAPLDEEMLITKVTFNGDRRGGQTTVLEMVPKGAIVLEPNDEPTQ
jgi:prophage tail gpP-like protein